MHTKPTHRIPVHRQLLFAELIVVILLSCGSLGILWNHWERTFPDHAHPYLMRGLFAILEFGVFVFTIWSVTFHSYWSRVISHVVKALLTLVLVVHAAAVLQFDTSLKQQDQNLQSAIQAQGALVAQQTEAQTRQLRELAQAKSQAERRGNWRLAANLGEQIAGLQKSGRTDHQTLTSYALNKHGKTFFSDDYMERYFFPVPLVAGVLLCLIGFIVVGHDLRNEPESLIYTHTTAQPKQVGFLPPVTATANTKPPPKA